MKVLQVPEESGQLGRLDNTFQPDAMPGLFLAPTIVLGPLREEHPGDCAMLEVVGARDGNPDLHSGPVGRQSQVLHAISRLL